MVFRIKINLYSLNNYNSIKFALSVGVARVPSTLSVRDILVSAYPASPLSTPARSRDIDTDMEALRISRHDNPFLKVCYNWTIRFQFNPDLFFTTCLVFSDCLQQVLASRESLADSLEESESDDTNLMSQVC